MPNETLVRGRFPMQYNMVSAPDFMPPHMIRDVQNRKFVDLFKRVYTNVPWYRNLLEEHNVNPESIKSIDDIVKLPFIKKTDLRETYPTGVFAPDGRDRTLSRVERHDRQADRHGLHAPRPRRVVRIGQPRSAFGITERDIIQVAYGYGSSRAVSAFTTGDPARLHGPADFRGNTERQLTLMRDLGVTTIACTPSYFLHILDYARKIGFDW